MESHMHIWNWFELRKIANGAENLILQSLQFLGTDHTENSAANSYSIVALVLWCHNICCDIDCQSAALSYVTAGHTGQRPQANSSQAALRT
jgi:hypothetical protein